MTLFKIKKNLGGLCRQVRLLSHHHLWLGNWILTPLQIRRLGWIGRVNVIFPLLYTGVDWKSLTATACLPVSTDFYPDRLSLERDFLEFNYELLAEEDIIGPFMTVEAIFQELISQRLLQVSSHFPQLLGKIFCRIQLWFHDGVAVFRSLYHKDFCR